MNLPCSEVLVVSAMLSVTLGGHRDALAESPGNTAIAANVNQFAAPIHLTDRLQLDIKQLTLKADAATADWQTEALAVAAQSQLQKLSQWIKQPQTIGLDLIRCGTSRGQ